MASSSSEEDEDDRKKFAELAGIAAKDISDAYVKNARPMCSSSARTNKAVGEKEITDGLTPEFRKHIAKKLSSYIESCIDEQSGHPKEVKNKTKIPGIHLFRLSKEKIVDVEKQVQNHSTPQLSNKHAQSGSDSSDDDSEALARFAEAAVCGQSIIDNGISNKEKDGNQNLIAEGNDSTESNEIKHKRKKKKKDKWKESKNEKDNHKRRKLKNC